MNEEQTLKANKYANDILELLRDRDEYTYSDLQGRVGAIVLNIMRGT
jgi:hypothetical protein